MLKATHLQGIQVQQRLAVLLLVVRKEAAQGEHMAVVVDRKVVVLQGDMESALQVDKENALQVDTEIGLLVGRETFHHQEILVSKETGRRMVDSVEQDYILAERNRPQVVVDESPKSKKLKLVTEIKQVAPLSCLRKIELNNNSELFRTISDSN